MASSTILFLAAVGAVDGWCISWRQTGDCRPDGPREPGKDKPCGDSIASTNSGYCECANSVLVSLVGCGHPAFACNDECPRRRSSTTAST